MRFDATTRATPEQVWRALTDFSDLRLRIWDRSLDPATYELRALGDTWAVARESTAGSPFWVVARYDWAVPGVVSFTIVESSYGGHGGGTIRVSPTEDGGSRLRAEWDYTDIRGVRDRVLLSLIHRFPMRTLIARMWVDALDRYAASVDD